MGNFIETIAIEIEEILGIDTEYLMRVGLLHPDDARKWLVKQKYYLLAKTGRSYADIKYELSEVYGLSVSTIEKLIYRK